MLKGAITAEEIQKIFGNADRKKEYLKILYKKQGITKRIPSKKDELDEEIESTWNYENSKTIIRELFFKSEKYSKAKQAKKKYNKLISQWGNKGYGDLDWPFAANNFDGYVAKINRKELSESKKDREITQAVIKFRRIKQINTLRNDIIENIIVENNESVIPTLSHSKKCDFYIDGIAFDQKVSRSVGKEFKAKHGENNYCDYAISHPKEVAKSLYMHQDEQRFGDEPRLYIVFLEENISIESIEKIIKETNFSKPYDFKFDYNHKSNGNKKHKTKCIVILMHN